MTTSELLVSCWSFDPLALAAVAATAVVLLGSRAARHGARPVPLALALLVLVIAAASPIGRLAEGYLFSAHMLQHLLLVLVVPPLALLGVAGMRAAPAPDDEDGHVRAALLTWILGVGAMWLWHEPTLCDAASRSPIVHRLQEVSLLAMGGAFWWPVLGPARARLQPGAGILYLFTACAACTLLGILITFSPVAVCSVFAHPVDRLGVMPLVRDGWGLSSEGDRQVGGLLMWVPACFVYAIAILGLVARLMRDPGEGPTKDAVMARATP